MCREGDGPVVLGEESVGDDGIEEQETVCDFMVPEMPPFLSATLSLCMEAGVTVVPSAGAQTT